jgi:hypothetical protein
MAGSAPEPCGLVGYVVVDDGELAGDDAEVEAAVDAAALGEGRDVVGTADVGVAELGLEIDGDGRAAEVVAVGWMRRWICHHHRACDDGEVVDDRVLAAEGLRDADAPVESMSDIVRTTRSRLVVRPPSSRRPRRSTGARRWRRVGRCAGLR